MILQQILRVKKEEVIQRKKELSRDAMQNAIRPAQRNFKQVLQQSPLSLIAEIKQRSPSERSILKARTFREVVTIYEASPFVDAISILTDKTFFGGKPELLSQARRLTHKPLLRKDFILDEYQVYESRYYGADAILLIARILSPQQLAEYIDLAHQLKMDCLVEIHNRAELQKLPDQLGIIGINNRDLDSLRINLDTTLRLAPQAQAKADVVVTESGIHQRQDVGKIATAADAMLVGTSILEAPSMAQQIFALMRPQIKICGITNQQDAYIAAMLGADFIGINFYPRSPRFVKPEKAHKIVSFLKAEYPQVKTVGVFVNATRAEIRERKADCDFDLIQLHGDESYAFMRDMELPVIKALRIKTAPDLEAIQQLPSDYILLDSYKKGHYGGTGQCFDWQLIKKVPVNKKIFLAGGINPQNIQKAAALKPYALDIASGVEKKAGEKDYRKLELIFKGAA